MAVKWTENQLNAIEARNGSLLISAAAGSGKTAVLVERVIQRIIDEENPIDANKLLVVTYTRAAAFEMKERIYAKLNELISKDTLNKHLRRQQLLLNNANISTIHSFCKDLIKENFYQLDISVDYRLADETEIKIIKTQAVESVVEDLYIDDSENFVEFVNLFSNAKSDILLKEVILKMYTFLIAHPFSESWLQAKEKMYDAQIPVKETLWGIVLTDYVKEVAEFCFDLAKLNFDLITENNYLGDKIYTLLNEDYEFTNLLKTKLTECEWDDIATYVATFNKGRLSVPKDYTNDTVKLTIQGRREILKSTLEKIQNIYKFTQSSFKEDIYQMSPVVHYLFKAVRLFDAKYKEIKKEKNIADFNDLEHWALNLLVCETSTGFEYTNFAKDVSNRFVEVMVDEYQDANELQDMIFTAVSNKGNNLFVVGDVKQSIYGFRQAMPEIFIRRKNNCELYNKEKDNYPSKVILDKNFRSRNGVTQAVNYVFKRLMSKKVGDMEYTDEEELVYGASYEQSNTPDMHFHLIKKGDAEENNNILEARHIANIIKQKMAENYQVNDKGNIRPLKFSDCCILLRSVSGSASDFTKELAHNNIPSSCETTPSFLSSYEIMVIMNFLRVIDNPLQDIPLLSVMLSPIGGFTEDSVAQIRLNDKKSPLYVALEKAKDSINDAEKFCKLLDELRSVSVTVDTSVLINIIFNETAFTSFVQADDENNIKINNLRLLLEYAKSFEKSGYRGLSSFIRYIDKIEEQNSDLASRTNGTDGVDTVKIMTIHHSKGLEYPLCFIANTSKRIQSDKNDEILMHSELGVGIRRKDMLLNCRYNTMPRLAISLEVERENISEELRVLYVAMTRAREKLYIIGTQPNPEKYISDIASSILTLDKIHPYIVRSVSTICEWITLCALLHKDGKDIRVNTNLTILDFKEDTTNWEIEIIEDVKHNLEFPKVADEQNTSNYDSEMIKNIDFSNIIEQFTKSYNNAPLTKIPVKVSASQIAHQDTYNKYSFQSKPKFAMSSELTGAKKGTAIHQFMQFANFENYIDNSIKEVERLVNKNYITTEQAKVLDEYAINKCLNSEIMQRQLKSQKTYREHRFSVKIKVSEVDKTIGKPYCDEEIILQGAIDTAFLEDNQLVIVDYKTDRVKNLEKLKELYTKQLGLYKFAMEKCTGLKVKECVIYSFELNSSIKV